MGSVKDGNLCQELIVVMLQCLLFVGDILAVEGGLLSVMIWSDLMLFHVDKYLKDLAFD